MTANGPEVAVVIPTRNREARLAFALEALAGQTLDPERFEVIVVRSADSRGPFASAPDGLRVRFLTHRGAPGPGAQRNTGWRETAAPIVAFTDDDCRPAPVWLESLLAHADPDDVLVQGPTEPDPDETHLQVGLYRTQWHLQPSEWFETCNIAYPRALLERLGGFDEGFVHSAEDADLGLRARQAGARRAFTPDALVFHAILPTPLPQALRETVQRTDATAKLIARHPDHRRRFFLRVFWKRSHAELLLAVAGGLAARRRPLLGVAAAIPYIDRYVHWPLLLRPRGSARFATFLGSRFVVDALELAMMARGALRHRVFVL